MSAPLPTRSKPSKAALSFLLGWHGLLSGGFLIAYITGEGSYAMHVFSGVMVLMALGIRVLVGLAAPKGSLLALPTLSLPPADQEPLGMKQLQKLLNNWMAAGLLVLITLAALSGWFVHDIGIDDDLHEGLAEATPALIFLHIAFAVTFHLIRTFPGGTASQIAMAVANKVKISKDI
ncbi:MAG: hypothetical protein ISR45_02075 [Rhodospirillales bacterium]|nr:hypothetical protein [Rhodospirillales bacterium]